MKKSHTKRILFKIINLIVYFVAKMNSKLPAIIEIEFKHVQGKGSGASTCEIEAKTALDFLAMRGINKPVVLDIGANVGSYSDAILRFNPEATIFAFEPSQVARRELESKFIDDSRVVIFPFALSNSNSIGILHSDFSGSGLASLTKRRLGHFGISFEHYEEVEIVTLDTWRKDHLIIPDLLKMDVEGHELDVLKGGIETLALVQVVQFEFGGCNIDTRTFFQDFWYLFTEAGFTIYRIAKIQPIRILHYSEEDEYFGTTNFLCVRE